MDSQRMSEPVFAQVIETPRMWLRCPMPGDGDALYLCVQQTLAQLQTWPDSLPWALQPQSPDISEDYCQTCYAAWVMGLRWPLLMWDKDTAQLAGSIGFHHINHDTQTWELGYWCSQSMQGQGRMTEAVSVLTAYVQQHWPQVRMLCRIDTRNTASLRVVQKAGFRREKEESLMSDSGLSYQVQHHVLGRALHTGQSD
jgi:RimJ/RimL family protein N-acetyltransferase